MRYEKLNGVSHIYVENGEDERLVLRAVVKASFELARPAGMGWLNFGEEQQMTDEDSDRFISNPLQCNDRVVEMDYVGGRQCKTYLRKVEEGHFILFNNAYERDRGLPEPMLEKAKEILAGKKSETFPSTSYMYKGNSLTLRLKEYGFTRLDGENDWEFRQRIFPDFYQISPNRAMEFLMGSSAAEWNEMEKLLCLALVSEGKQDRSSLERFARGFADDPLVMWKK